VVYAGLAALFLNHMILPWTATFAGIEVPTIDLPGEFWAAWGGICSLWVLGRSAEKYGTKNRMTQLLTGTKP
jgi:hypothetical protein